MTKIKNIIFDFGGVIIDIDYHATINAFKAMGLRDFDLAFSQLRQTEVFDNLETGKISPSQFCSEMNAHFGGEKSEIEIFKAWNAMLGTIPAHRLEMLLKLKEKCPTYLLSNTNEIHLKHIFKYTKSAYGQADMDAYFHKTYYSHKMGLRKPNANIFDKVIIENDLDPEETLFIDDSSQHIVGAKKVGLHTLHLVGGLDIVDVLKKMNLYE
ncbi:MAG: FMN phosphatase YigB (HAD superfamily) [Sphingobacteriales bacterium]|jgi:FMN phosphatase YigB (HAD superfamily)